MKFTPYPPGDERGCNAQNLNWVIETRKGGGQRIVLYPDSPEGWDRGIPCPSDKATAFIRLYGTLEDE